MTKEKLIEAAETLIRNTEQWSASMHDTAKTLRQMAAEEQERACLNMAEALCTELKRFRAGS